MNCCFTPSLSPSTAPWLWSTFPTATPSSTRRSTASTAHTLCTLLACWVGAEAVGARFRGTLRYSGFCSSLYAMARLGLLREDALPAGAQSWVGTPCLAC